MLCNFAKKEALAFRASISDSRTLLDAAIGHMKTTLDWDTVYFNDGGAGDKILKAHNLNAIAARNEVFAVKGLRIIFINRTVKNKIHPYLHEVAHIVLKHDFDALSLENETEANEFADYLLKPRLNSQQILTYVLAAALAISLILHVPGIVHSKARQATTVSAHLQTTEFIENSDSIVVVTLSGDKYHRPDCRYVQNKTNVQEITIEKATALGKTPCKVCNP